MSRTGIAEHINALEFLIKYDRGYHRGFDPNEPRDEDGKWTDGGGGGESGGSDKQPVKLDPKVVEVGGDEWNKATARRLEREYQQAKPKLDEIVDKAVGKDVEEPTEEDEDEPEEPYVPESWDELSDDVQEQAGKEYAEKEFQTYLDNEHQNYFDSGDALDDAKSQLVDTTMHGPGADHDKWLIEAINEYREDAPRIPFDTQQLVEAISLDYQNGNQGSGDFTVEFDDDKLQEPSNLTPPEQMTLPTIEPPKPHEQLTKDMRDGLTKAIEKAFDEEADDLSPKLTPPDYLAEGAAEFAQESWNSGLDDEQKFEWIKNNTNLIADNTESNTKPGTAEAGYWHIDALPKKYDPLNNTDGEDYKRTQALARYLSVERAAQVLTDRNLIEDEDLKSSKSALTRRLAKIDSQLWSAWKGSSTSIDGTLLQLATADELNGRLRQAQSFGRALIDRDDLQAYANRNFEDIGGYQGIKAYVRAKWEVTQHLLDKAGISELELYRGIALPRETLEKSLARKQVVTEIGSHKLLPKLHVERNGAASTTTDPGIANGWSRDDTRVVLRALMPRTAAVSVPAYGINIHSEHEVVVAGTAWKGWDAWRGRAPRLGQVPLQEAA